jgi:hypothetical protein
MALQPVPQKFYYSASTSCRLSPAPSSRIHISTLPESFLKRGWRRGREGSFDITVTAEEAAMLAAVFAEDGELPARAAGRVDMEQ